MNRVSTVSYAWGKYEMGNTKRKERSSNRRPNQGLYQDRIDWLLAIDAA